jgi:hypothetical protein
MNNEKANNSAIYTNEEINDAAIYGLVRTGPLDPLVYFNLKITQLGGEEMISKEKKLDILKYMNINKKYDLITYKIEHEELVREIENLPHERMHEKDKILLKEKTLFIMIIILENQTNILQKTIDYLENSAPAEQEPAPTIEPYSNKKPKLN